MLWWKCRDNAICGIHGQATSSKKRFCAVVVGEEGESVSRLIQPSFEVYHRLRSLMNLSDVSCSLPAPDFVNYFPLSLFKSLNR
jgi:hypothetical protein